MEIVVQHVTKKFSVFEKKPGLLGSVKSIFVRKYKDKVAIDDLSFTVPSGKLIAFLGPNGSGKTTMMKMLSGILVPTEGQITIGEFTPHQRKRDFLKQISLVMGQKSQLWWDLPTLDSLEFFRSIYDISHTDFQKRVEELSTLLDSTDLLHTPVRKLSLGERMRCELIAALLHNPQLLFLDEPTIGLDIVSQQKIRQFIQKYHQEKKATILLTSHNMGDIESLCDHLMILHKGKMLFEGSLNAFKTKHDVSPIIRVTLQKPQALPKFKKPYGQNYVTDLVVEITVPYNDLAEVTAKLLQDLKLTALHIKEPSLDEIMHQFFTLAAH